MLTSGVFDMKLLLMKNLPSPIKVRRLFQLGVKAEIIEPLSARNDFVAFIDSLRDMY